MDGNHAKLNLDYRYEKPINNLKELEQKIHRYPNKYTGGRRKPSFQNHDSK